MLNQSLKRLYESKWDLLQKNFRSIVADDLENIKPANPLLISLSDEEAFSSADIRLMIFGQETNTWCRELNNLNVNDLQAEYKIWFYEGSAKSYGGFYRGLFRFVDLVKQRFPIKNIEFVWNNLSKIGKIDGRGMQSQKLYKCENDCFNVITEEIKTLKPNLILFLTGPNRDYLIQERLHAIDFSQIKDYELNKLARINDLLDIPSFRTYHTQYLGFTKKTDEYFNAIIDELNL